MSAVRWLLNRLGWWEYTISIGDRCDWHLKLTSKLDYKGAKHVWLRVRP